jgi:hypothetical protein
MSQSSGHSFTSLSCSHRRYVVSVGFLVQYGSIWTINKYTLGLYMGGFAPFSVDGWGTNYGSHPCMHGFSFRLGFHRLRCTTIRLPHVQENVHPFHWLHCLLMPKQAAKNRRWSVNRTSSSVSPHSSSPAVFSILVPVNLSLGVAVCLFTMLSL